MKANEIQIGDYVEPRQCMIPTVYCKVEGIYPDGTVHLDKAEMLFTLDELTPVPLTPEILEKNGFVDERSNYAYRTDNYHVCYYCADERLSINKYGAILDVHCFYVHQLQHALRLCGIEKTIEL